MARSCKNSVSFSSLCPVMSCPYLVRIECGWDRSLDSPLMLSSLSSKIICFLITVPLRITV